jgi:hypothetical protein
MDSERNIIPHAGIRSGWLKSYLERRMSQQKDRQLILEGFLHAFEAIL